jgi:hypothetical protein
MTKGRKSIFGRLSSLAGGSPNIMKTNKVTAVSRNIQSKLSKQFGITPGTIFKAATGDLDACQRLGEMGRQGERISMFMPIVKDSVLKSIQGTVVLNEAMSEINRAAGDGISRINTAVDAADLANVRFVDGETIRALKTKAAKELQGVNHQAQLQIVHTQNVVNKHLATTNNAYSLLKAELVPEIKDVELQEAHHLEMANYYLAKGESAIDSHKPIKQYNSNKLMDEIRSAWEATKSVIVGQ